MVKSFFYRESTVKYKLSLEVKNLDSTLSAPYILLFLKRKIKVEI